MEKKLSERKIKEGDIVRYPVGWTLVVRKVYKDENNDLYVKIPDLPGSKEYIYKNQYPWGGALIKQLGFGLASKEEIKYLDDTE